MEGRHKTTHGPAKDGIPDDVLILVVVEDGLLQALCRPDEREWLVLILVVMEYGLGEISFGIVGSVPTMS